MEITISDYRTQIEFPQPRLVTITFKPPTSKVVFDFQVICDGVKVTPIQTYCDIYFKYDDNWVYAIRILSNICVLKTTNLLPT